MKSEAISQLIPLAICLLAMILTGSATLITGCLILIRKEQHRVKALDTFMILATITMALGYLGDLLPHDKVGAKASKQEHAEPSIDVDPIGNRLNGIAYLGRLPQPFLFISEREGDPTLKEALESMQEYLENQLKKTPDDSVLKSKLAILKHERGEKLDEIFATANDGKEKNSSHLLTTLQKLYTASKEDVASDTDIVLEDNLAKGWYRNCALKYFYQKIDSPKLAAFTRDQEKLASDYSLRLQFFLILRMIFCGIGFFAIFRFFYSNSKAKLDSNAPNNAPRYFPFRNWYGCALAYFCAQQYLGIAAFAVAGFVVAVTSSTLQADRVAPIINVFCRSAATIVFAICVNRFILKASNIKSVRDFLAEHKLSVRDFSVTVSGGFCSMVAILTALKWIAVLIPEIQGSQNNAMQQTAEALVSSNSAMVASLIVMICVLGPIVEETLFRGLMYPWMRNKVGVSRAIILTSLAFGLWHFDLSGLIHYFAIGMVLTLMFERKRNLMVTCAMHAIWNTWVVVGMTVIMT